MSRLISAVRACISSPLNVVITVGVLYWAATTLPDLFEWTLWRAVWSGSSPKVCAGVDAACWLFIRAHAQQILIGSYPVAERWRIIMCLLVGAIIIVTLALLCHRHKALLVIVATAVYSLSAGVLLYGGVLGLPIVRTQNWGGLFLTVVVAGWTIASSLPAGLVLALARRSHLPVVAGLAAIYIDLLRGLPLVGILFVAIIMFPLFVPPHLNVDPLVRALLAFSGFNAAIMAEVIRGALQSVAPGQSEAARALGLSSWQTLALCILPQALRVAVPGIINVSIAIIKETTVILMAGMFDFLGVLQGALIDPQWLIGDQVRQTAYFFAGLVFFLCCFTLSLWSTSLEARLKSDEGV